MINYTERLTLLMQDIVSRVQTLSFIDVARRAGVRAVRTVERRRRVRHLPLPESAAERTGLLLLARSRHRPDHPPLGMVRHQVTGGHDRRAPDQVSDLVHAAALLRSVAGSFAQGTVLPPGRRCLDREARYGDSRALSHRPGTERHPPPRNAATASTRRNCHTPQFFEPGRGHGLGISRLAARSGCLRFSPSRLRALEHEVWRRCRRRASGRSRPIRSVSSSGSHPAAMRSGRRGGRCRALAAFGHSVPLHRRRSARPPVHREMLARMRARASSKRRSAPFTRAQPRRPGGRRETLRPVSQAEMLDPNHAGRARRVHEFIAAQRDADVRCARRSGREEDQIARAPPHRVEPACPP